MVSGVSFLEKEKQVMTYLDTSFGNILEDECDGEEKGSRCER